MTENTYVCVYASKQAKLSHEDKKITYKIPHLKLCFNKEKSEFVCAFHDNQALRMTDATKYMLSRMLDVIYTRVKSLHTGTRIHTFTNT